MKRIIATAVAASLLATGAMADARYAAETEGLTMSRDSLEEHPNGGFFATPRKYTEFADVNTQQRAFFPEQEVRENKFYQANEREKAIYR